MASTEGPRTVVVGLDGADFELLVPWLERGELPTLRRIVEEGVSGDLESVLPPVTSPNWKAYATGKNPGKLGIFWWWNVDVEGRRTYRPSERYNETTEYWELLAERESVGVIGVPTTYPPKEFGEFVVSGAPDGEDEGFAYPPSIESELRERFGYRLERDHHLRTGTDAAYREVLDGIDSRFAAAKFLADRYDVDFLQVATFYINALHHHAWDDEWTLRGWKRIDDHLPSFLDEGRNVVLLSDHGMAEIRYDFRINEWLAREGYLSYDASTTEALYALGINATRLKLLLSRLDRLSPAVDLRGLVERAIPQWVVNRLPNQDGDLGPSKHSQIDWEASDALASGLGPVYLLGSGDGAEALREELLERLSTLEDPSGRPVAEAVYRGEEVYDGQYADEAPDLVLEPARGINATEEIGNGTVFDAEPRLSAMNARHGIFAATGPDFATGIATDLSILDLAPTLLHLEGCAVPTDMDGDVRRDLFAAGSDPADREPRDAAPTTRSADEGSADPADDMREQLQDLGYL